jgi:DNA-binding IclR family transcriptional regulator
VGKAWLAALSTKRVDRLLGTGTLSAITDRTITDPAALRAELDMIRARGYADSHGESEDGVGSVAMAVRDSGGEPRLAMSVAIPLNRFTDEAHDEAVARLREAVDALAPRLSELGPGF